MAKTRGFAIAGVGGFGFVYYTLWVIITVSFRQPFIDSNNSFQAFFPDRFWALMIPSVLLLGLIAVVSAFVGLTLIKSYSLSVPELPDNKS